MLSAPCQVLGTTMLAPPRPVVRWVSERSWTSRTANPGRRTQNRGPRTHASARRARYREQSTASEVRWAGECWQILSLLPLFTLTEMTEFDPFLPVRNAR